MQISARGLLEPLTTAKPANEGIDIDDGDMAGVNNPDETIGSDDEDENAGLDGGVDESDDNGDLMDGLDDDEKEDLIESTKEAADALQKVRRLTSIENAANDRCSSVAQPGFCRCALDNQSASCMARSLQGSRHVSPTHPTRCQDLLEQYIRHDQRHTSISGSPGRHHSQQGIEAAQTRTR